MGEQLVYFVATDSLKSLQKTVRTVALSFILLLLVGLGSVVGAQSGTVVQSTGYVLERDGRTIVVELYGANVKVPAEPASDIGQTLKVDFA